MMSPRDLSPNSGLAPRIIQQMLEGKARTQGQVRTPTIAGALWSPAHCARELQDDVLQ